MSIARNAAKQGKLSAAEADARRALLGILKAQGKYNPTTPNFIIGLAGILVEQGRYKEAEKLGRSALDVQRTIGIADEAPLSAAILSSLGNIRRFMCNWIRPWRNGRSSSAKSLS